MKKLSKKFLLSSLVLGLAISCPACGNLNQEEEEEETKTDTDAKTDSVSDSDSDAVSDTDTDADSDSDTDQGCENPLFEGENCDQCINGKFGSNCDQDCENPLFKGENCDQCVNGKFGTNCDQDCENPLFKGENCDQCVNGKFGYNCDQDCENPLFKGENCDQCVNELMGGPNCDQCLNGKSGINCDQCSNGAWGENCDCFDNNVYGEITINNQIWMAKNLQNGCVGHYSANGSDDNDQKYGYLYTWENALIACPKGWRLPSKDDFDALLSYVKENTSNAFLALITTSDWNNYTGLDTYGFGALPAGQYINDEPNYFNMDAGWWSKTDEGDFSSTAYNLYLGYGEANVYANLKTYAYSVRCIKEGN